jgi:hypothetical protein
MAFTQLSTPVTSRDTFNRGDEQVCRRGWTHERGRFDWYTISSRQPLDLPKLWRAALGQGVVGQDVPGEYLAPRGSEC